MLFVRSLLDRNAAPKDLDGAAATCPGSHIWNNLHDGMGRGAEASPAEPETFDYDGYPRFLAERGHNFIRLWRWEQVRSQAAGGNYHLNMTPQPWARTRPGIAKDGKPKFDLERFDAAFFNRLRERVIKAGDAGIYVGVMPFDGWALHLSPAPDHVEGHPFHALNNINGIGATSIDDLQVLPLATHRGAPGGIHHEGRRHPPQSAQRALGGRQRVVRRRGGHQGVRAVPRHGRSAQVG
jgi:hypothetical protein